MKFSNVKRCLSGLLAAMLVLSSCGTSTPVYAGDGGYPPLEEVIDQLDEDEIVIPNDYEVAAGSDFDVSIDFSNLDIPDISKVGIFLDEAVNDEGEWFSTDHEDSYRTTYYVEPVSGNPSYRITRSIRVRERSPKTTVSKGTVRFKTAMAANNEDASESKGTVNKDDKESSKDGSGDQDDDPGHTGPVSASPGAAAGASLQDASVPEKNSELSEEGQTSPKPESESSSVTDGTDGETPSPDDSSSEGKGNTSTDGTGEDASGAGKIPEKQQADESAAGINIPEESLPDTTVSDEAAPEKPSSDKSRKDESTAGAKPDDSSADKAVKDESIDLSLVDESDAGTSAEGGGIFGKLFSFVESLVGASGTASIDDTVNCFSGGFGAVYVNHAYQTSGNSGGDRIVYCGEVDMHFEAGPHTRQNLVGSSLQGHVVTEAEAIYTGLMQNYFFYVAGLETDVARGLTQRAIWAMAVGDNAASVNNYHWLGQAGLTDVYEAAKAYAAANASKYVLKEAYALVNGDTQKLVYIDVTEKPAPATPTPTNTPTPTPTSTPTPTPTPSIGRGKVVKRSSVDSINGNENYSLAGAVYGIYSDSGCTHKITQLTTGEAGETEEYELEAGTYYVKEIKAPKNFRLNDRIYTLKVEAEKTSTVNAADGPEYGSVSLLKTSEDGGSMSVKGTKYTVYRDEGCTESAGVLTVGEDGKSNVLNLYYGTYYVKETQAAPGFMLDETVHTVKISGTQTVELKVTDSVQRAGISLTKRDADLNTNEAQGLATLKGAEISVINQNSYEVTVKGRTYAQGETVLTITTDADGKASTDKDAFPAGKYSWKETKAPKGYGIGEKSSGSFTVNAENAGTIIDLSGEGPVDKVLRAGIRIGKLDRERNEKEAQGDASLAGAVIEIMSANEQKVFVDGRPYEKGETVAALTTGENGSAATGADALPVGRYTWKETKAPEGYLLSGKTSGGFTLTEENAGKVIDLGSEGPADDIIRGGVKIGKWEKETQRRDPQGSSSLENTAFVIINKSAYPVLVDGKLYENGATIATVRTDKKGYWESKEKWLPYGTYAILETEAPEGHQNAGTQVTFQIRKDGETANIDRGQFRDQVFRGDLELVKAGQNRKERLANVAFLVTSKTTGEAHVLVTDPNGQAGTGTSYAAHTADTNKNDDAYKDGKVDDTKLSHEYGIWFSGESDVAVAPNDATGALPYDTYTVKELRCAGNAGYELVSYDITVYRDGAVVDCGTVDDEEIPKVEIGTMAMNSKAKTPEAYHIALAEEKTGLTDKVSYEGLKAGKTYTLKTVLMDRDTGTVVQDTDGKEISMETKLKVHLWNQNGTIDIPAVFNAEGLAGHSVVFFEYLYDEDGKEIAKHTDIGDEEQTIVFPIAETEASDSVTNENVILPAKDIKVKDILRYENLLVGKEYLATGKLMDKKTGKPVVDDDGNAVTATKRFTAESKNGAVEILFEFSGVKLAGTVMVAFETVSISGVEIMTHADINDEDQTVYVPSIGTKASCKETGEQVIGDDGIHTILDHVSYKSLPEGKYVMQGTLMNKATGGAFVDAQGNVLTAETIFEVTEMSGSVDVEFRVDTAAFAGKTVVAFEKAYRIKDDGMREDTPAAVHEDLNDEDQTVTFPKIGTVLIDKESGAHYANASEKVTHIDTVKCTGLIIGKEYTVRGKLVDKETGAAVVDGGKEVTAEKTFKADKTDGAVEIEFTFNASALAGRSVVAFEELHTGGRLIASHADLSDEDQTVHYPKICTELKDVSTGTHFVPAADSVTLVDTVTYSNLIPGRTYNLDGQLMDKETGKELKINNELVRVTTQFTADAPDGTAELFFTVNGAEIAGKTLVAFEVLFDWDILVAVHADINDEAQTVYVPDLKTELINNETCSHHADALNPRNFTDEVNYTNLFPGVPYTMKGVLVDKATGNVLTVGGTEIRAEKTFTPPEKNGYEELAFEFDCTSLNGKSIVAFEYLYRDGIMVASHADIRDEAQTVTIGKGTTPTPTARPTSTPVTPRNVTGKASYSGSSAAGTAGGKAAGQTTTSQSKPVKTGDTSNIFLPVLLTGASVLAIGIVFLKKKTWM